MAEHISHTLKLTASICMPRGSQCAWGSGKSRGRLSPVPPFRYCLLFVPSQQTWKRGNCMEKQGAHGARLGWAEPVFFPFLMMLQPPCLLLRVKWRSSFLLLTSLPPPHLCNSNQLGKSSAYPPPPAGGSLAGTAPLDNQVPCQATVLRLWGKPGLTALLLSLEGLAFMHQGWASWSHVWAPQRSQKQWGSSQPMKLLVELQPPPKKLQPPHAWGEEGGGIIVWNGDSASGVAH